MKSIKLIVVIFISIIVFSNYAFSVGENVEATTKGQTTKVSTAGGQFLKVPIGARGMGMAGAYGSVADDLSALYWNLLELLISKQLQPKFPTYNGLPLIHTALPLHHFR